MPKGSAAVAVVTRTKDRPVLLRRAIRSVMQQTFDDLHMVVVNDGGDPGPVEAVVSELGDIARGRLSVVHHEASKGMEAASNAGIRATDSTYLCIHDDDDSWHPRFLEVTVGTMEASGHLGAVTGAVVIMERVEGDEVKLLDKVKFNTPPSDDGKEPWADPLEPEFDPAMPVRRRAKRMAALPEDPTSLFDILGYNQFPPIAFCYARRALDVVGLYDERLPVLGDWDFNVRFYEHYDVDFVDRPLAYYHHRHGAQGAMVNTIVAGHDDVRQRLLNRYLREDLAAGKLGKGWLANWLHDERDTRDYLRAWYDDEHETIRQLELDLRVLFDGVHEGLRHVDGRVLGVNDRVERLERASAHGTAAMAASARSVGRRVRGKAGRAVRTLRNQPALPPGRPSDDPGSAP